MSRENVCVYIKGKTKLPAPFTTSLGGHVATAIGATLLVSLWLDRTSLAQLSHVPSRICPVPSSLLPNSIATSTATNSNHGCPSHAGR